MNRFIQIHFLTSYPPSNLNRDDLGRPKTAILGGVNRLRISSQSLKRAWRTSDLFRETLPGHIGTRTKDKGKEIYQKLLDGNIPEKNARAWSKSIAGIFGKLKSPSEKDLEKDPLLDLEIEQLSHFSKEENEAISSLIQKLIDSKKEPSNEDLNLLKKENSSSDIAMFGRMLASKPAFNVEAAVQVAHAITVHKVAIEDDFFTAVDDLNSGIEDVGAGHLGEVEFGSGLFYLYICVNREQLLNNLNGNKDLAKRTVKALVETASTISPTGKQNSFASRARALYCLVEKGNEQPRSLHTAFLNSVEDKGILNAAISKLESGRQNFEKVYGSCASGGFKTFNVDSGNGSLKEILEFAQED
ncbi:type I-E CRISPR-associated protein Cas7/Cse4/CasC [Leptospira santarosai]|uniref:type I-E CRISPR-associated protein Cas7/Cse4/CasC n=1 Tax=Leptospira santarosai TaxID=28183 RepID=UPI0002DDCFBE|nr:type I-E CRISPR-associated protein Cas7/Cse4/CasC [Leptospira santarosai]UZN08031.1 type I-E CRISPR-associated protein Cas7/Cse4/CasC [Leptospira santarosai]